MRPDRCRSSEVTELLPTVPTAEPRTGHRPYTERSDYAEVVLARRLRDALARLNRELPAGALADAFPRLTRPQGATLEARSAGGLSPAR